MRGPGGVELRRYSDLRCHHHVSTELRHTAVTLHAIGQALRSRGQHARALEHYQRALARQRLVGGGRHPHLPSTLSAIAELLMERGEPAQALEHRRQAIALKRELLGPGHIFTAYAMVELGQTLEAVEQRSEALQAYARALTVLQKQLGNHPRTASTQQAIAAILQAQGHFTEALNYARDALAMRERLEGPDSPALAPMLTVIGGALFQQGHHDDAIASLRRGLAVLAGCDPGDERLLAVHLDLGRALHRQGDSAGALASFQANLDGARTRLGEDHPRIASTLNAIGQVHYSTGNFAAALDHYKQALDLRQRTLGTDHWQTATSRFNCGTAMRELGDPWGLTEMQSAADTLERLLGPQHPHVMATRSWLQ